MNPSLSPPSHSLSLSILFPITTSSIWRLPFSSFPFSFTLSNMHIPQTHVHSPHGIFLSFSRRYGYGWTEKAGREAGWEFLSFF
jgi:hypothetical protein